MSSIIQSLQTRQLIWHATQVSQDPSQQLLSGFATLDQKLGGGWPDKGIIELQIEQQGIGEVRLLLPVLASLQQRQRQQQSLYLWVSPPARLNGQALLAAGLPLANTLVAVDISAEQAFWISERSLRSGCCAAVILWCNEIEANQAKRLQLAAKEGNCLGIIIRPPGSVCQSLPVSVRMGLKPQAQGLQLNITKRLGGSPVAPFMLDLNQRWPYLYEPKISIKEEAIEKTSKVIKMPRNGSRSPYRIV